MKQKLVHGAIAFVLTLVLALLAFLGLGHHQGVPLREEGDAGLPGYVKEAGDPGYDKLPDGVQVPTERGPYEYGDEGGTNATEGEDVVRDVRWLLRDLDPEWLVYVDATRARYTDDGDAAQGLEFDCPHCGGPRSHRIRVWFEGAPDDAWPHRARWQATTRPQPGVSRTFDNLTLSPSIQLTSGCMWHGWIIQGAVTETPKVTPR